MKGCAEAEGEEVPEAPDRWAHAAKESGHVGPTLLSLGRFLVPIFRSMSFFSKKNDVVFFPDLISYKNNQKRDFAKNGVRFSSFYSNMGRFRSKLLNKVIGKVDAFWMHQLPQS